MTQTTDIKPPEETTDIKPPEETTDIKPPEETTNIKPPEDEIKRFLGVELTPCNWIISQDGDNISAVNTISGRVFEGSMKQFNSLLNARK